MDANVISCAVWVWNHKSNAHACIDKYWFKEYTPFEFEIVFWVGDQPRTARVQGVGNVSLPVKEPPFVVGRPERGELNLTNVLHIPDLPCNIVGKTPDIGYCMNEMPDRRYGYMFDRGGGTGACWLVFRTAGIMQLADHKLDNTPSRAYLPSLNARFLTWEAIDCQDWLSHKAALQQSSFLQSHPSSRSGTRASSIITMGTETLWLITKFISEDIFLWAHGLDPHKEEDRVEGRGIVRAMINYTLLEEQRARRRGRGLTPHIEPIFSEMELRYINKGWGNVCEFMRSIHFDVGREDHWQEAKRHIGIVLLTLDEPNDKAEEATSETTVK
ncbi:hypothetical protein F5B17DRAFT_433834 [Nemania serpens]|nr:hypothetical protein F5B17DRAFT_433834 [Nemania serpens]